MTTPGFTIDKIKFGTDAPTFEKAVALYEKKKVTKLRDDGFSFRAIVLGTSPYEVTVDARHYDRGTCNCYLGQNDYLCKHMVAVAICALLKGKSLSRDDITQYTEPKCSGRVAELLEVDLKKIKSEISEAMKYIRAYDGPSRTWFAYQGKLDEGCARLSKIVSNLPVSERSCDLLVKTLLRLDKKLSHGGVDDSNGTVGGFIEQAVQVILEFHKLVPECRNSLRQLRNIETCFEWEDPLVRLLDS